MKTRYKIGDQVIFYYHEYLSYLSGTEYPATKIYGEVGTIVGADGDSHNPDCYEVSFCKDLIKKTYRRFDITTYRIHEQYLIKIK